jgi:3-oxoacyl-[acyl-carrier protein] reductase
MKTVIITGSSRGIGRATALHFARHGWNVVIHGFRHPNQLQSLEKEISELGVNSLSFIGDISQPDFVSQMIERSIRHFGTIDCLVNNAGISKVGLFTDMTMDDWNEMIGTNLTSVFLTCRNILPHMIRNHSGKIINVSSIWGDAGASCEVLYSAAKGGVNTFTKALAKETAASNIQVNAVSFGMIDTEMNSEFNAEDLEMIKEEIPADYIAAPEEAAHMIYHAATAPAYWTGQISTFSGGWYI